jgi:hypothetical protein
MANHKLSIDTTQDPCKFSLDSTFNRIWTLQSSNVEGRLAGQSAGSSFPQGADLKVTSV